MKVLERLLIPFLALSCLAASGCREGSDSASLLFVPLTQAPFGNSGCDGPNQAFAAKVVVVTNANIGPMSQLAAAKNVNKLYLTGVGATVFELDLDAAVLALTPIIPVGDVDVLLLAEGIVTPAELSGLAVATTTSLVAVEHTSNTLLQVGLVPPDVQIAVGIPNETPGNIDGFITNARFSFPPGRPLQIVLSGDGSVWVADAGNHLLRRVVIDQSNLLNSFVVTQAGTGVPVHVDGDLMQASFDTPVGLNIACAGELLMSTVGANGNRLLSLAMGEGAMLGTSLTLAGDGVDATLQGIGEAASLGQPVSPASSSAGEIYWVDSSTGILRRYTISSGLVDCPLNPGCNTSGTDFSGPGNYSAAIAMDDKLYILDGNAGTICRVSL